MTLSELILLIQWEVQKSYNLIEELSRAKTNEDSINMHLGMEKVDLTIPISFSERDIFYDSINKIAEDARFRKFYYPLIIQSDKEVKGKSRKISPRKKGKVLDVEVKCTSNEKLKNGSNAGQLTISFSKVFS